MVLGQRYPVVAIASLDELEPLAGLLDSEHLLLLRAKALDDRAVLLVKGPVVPLVVNHVVSILGHDGTS